MSTLAQLATTAAASVDSTTKRNANT